MSVPAAFLLFCTRLNFNGQLFLLSRIKLLDSLFFVHNMALSLHHRCQKGGLSNIDRIDISHCKML